MEYGQTKRRHGGAYLAPRIRAVVCTMAIFLHPVRPEQKSIAALINRARMLGDGQPSGGVGPAMAVALLTTLYGAFIANVLFLPMITSLEGYTAYEVTYREMVVMGLRNIARGESPRNIQDQMVANLPPAVQQKLEAAA